MSEPVTYRLPVSTLDYLTDPVVHTAVNSLLDVADDAMPASLERDEISNYYRARAAALAVKYDTVIALEELWRVVWGDIVSKWSFYEKHIDEITPDSTWSDRDFWMRHQRSGFDFYTAVQIQGGPGDDTLHIMLACSLEGPAGDEVLDGHLDGFALSGDKGDWNGWMLAQSPVSFSPQEDWDLAPLLEAVSHVRTVVAERIASRG